MGHEADVEAWDGGDGVEEGVMEGVSTVCDAEAGYVGGSIGLRSRQTTSGGFQLCKCEK